MKTGIILGVVIGIVITVILVILLVVLLILPAIRQTETKSISTGTPIQSTTKATTSLSQPLTTSTGKPTGTTTAPIPANVNFDLNVTNVSISGITSATVTSRLSNTGTGDAHNTWAKVEVFYQGARLKVQGQDFFRQDIGLLKAKEIREIAVTLTFNPIDALKILQNGANIALTLYSDEKTQSMSYDYRPQAQ